MKQQVYEDALRHILYFAKELELDGGRDMKRISKADAVGTVRQIESIAKKALAK